ncbi:hypothetical protein I3842_01G191300 [Carya illinoinensis]|uniref:Sieve element occlusion N-terminal domain-containing protein n=1 Tax=Carya illinoinensis TaxID=32201 RepID=A0A922KD12_CARIL|nr:hypothetical protein I3842_01G191300 [Carya illinoinensis]
MSDHDIMNHIHATHIPGDEKFDVDSLFLFAENILKRASLIIDNVALDLLHGTEAHRESLDGMMSPKASFNPPLCTLKRISGEVTIKGQ